MRNQFEEWAAEQTPPLALSKKESGEYRNYATRAAWRAWQESTQRGVKAPVADLVLAGHFAQDHGSKFWQQVWPPESCAVALPFYFSPEESARIRALAAKQAGKEA